MYLIRNSMASVSYEIKRTICAVVGSMQARDVNCSDLVTNITGRAKFTSLLTSLDVWYDMTQRVEKLHTNRCFLFVVHIPLQCKEHKLVLVAYRAKLMYKVQNLCNLSTKRVNKILYKVKTRLQSNTGLKDYQNKKCAHIWG